MDIQLKPLADAIARTNKYRPISGFSARPVNDDEDDFRIRDYAEFRCEAVGNSGEADFRRMASHVLSQYMKSSEKWQTHLDILKVYVGSPDDPNNLEEYIHFRFTPFNIHVDAQERVSAIETMITLASKWVDDAFAK